MSDPQKKPGVAFWASVVVVVAVLYVASMPVALTLSDLPRVPGWIRDIVATVYGPLLDLLLWLSGDTL